MKLSKGTKVFVTGGCGFIGSHLVEKLVTLGCHVKVLVGYNNHNSWGNLDEIDKNVHKSIEVVLGNILDPFLVRSMAKGCDAAFHLAALIGIPYSYLSPSAYVDTNIRGTLNVLQACRDENIQKLVHTSTSEVYGTARYTPINEEHPLQAQSPYSATKIGADKLAESFYSAYQLPVAIMRPFNAYGPRQSARAVIPTVISQIASGLKEIKLGLLSPIRDFNYVKDTVNGFIEVAQSEKSVGQVINIGSGRGISIGELVNLIANLMGEEIRIVCDENRVRPPNSEVFALICDNTKARELTGWKPSYSLENGLLETIEYIKQRLSQYKTEVYNV